MCFLNTYKVQKNLAGLEPQRNRMGNIADKQHKLYTYKVKIDLAGLEASLTRNSRQTTMF
ncbi:hypothetical protein C21_04032 [Arenibacter sp. NBRC 103722]|nr:hypothetical protein C21_04032 [Arenibacter sp. NBRC 103722]